MCPILNIGKDMLTDFGFGNYLKRNAAMYSASFFWSPEKILEPSGRNVCRRPSTALLASLLTTRHIKQLSEYSARLTAVY